MEIWNGLSNLLYYFFVVAKFDFVISFIYFYCEFVTEFVWLVEKETSIGGFKFMGVFWLQIKYDKKKKNYYDVINSFCFICI